MAPKKHNIVFFHPDLGIGGAERLIVDAAVSLQDLGHKVTIFTSYCNRDHCFDEARDGTLDVRVRGDAIIPPAIFGRFSILCAILRQLHLVLQISLFSSELQKLSPDVFFVDQLSACIPFLRSRITSARVLFYCHFPDKLLARRSSAAKSLYRIPFDWLEGWTTGLSDIIVVNSNFTGSIFAEAFPTLSHRTPKVVYPCVDTASAKSDISVETETESSLFGGKKVLLSINRFERTKGVTLAIRAFARLDPELRKSTRLIIAGGYDPRMMENVTYHERLGKLADKLNLKHTTLKILDTDTSVPSDVEVMFLLSVSSSLKALLLRAASLLLYTPGLEHFGIVPLEAMLARTPVLAANTGGPTETVVDEETGWLRSVKDVDGWAEIMKMVLVEKSEEELNAMGEKGRQRVIEQFSKEKMAQRLEEEIEHMLAAQERPRVWGGMIKYLLLGLGFLCGIALALYL